MDPKRSLAALLLAAFTLMLSEISPHVQVDDTGLHVALALAATGVGSTEGELAVAYKLLLAYSAVWGEGSIPMACAAARLSHIVQSYTSTTAGQANPVGGSNAPL
jgi:hypothetical protein